MPELNILLNAEEDTFRALHELYTRYPLLQNAPALLKAGHLIHLDTNAPLEIGAMPRGMVSGEPSIAFCFRLPNRKVVIAETSLRLLFAAADAFRSRYGDPRMHDLGMPALTLPPDVPALGVIRSARLLAEHARDAVSGPALDELSRIVQALKDAESLDGVPAPPPEWKDPSA